MPAIFACVESRRGALVETLHQVTQVIGVRMQGVLELVAQCLIGPIETERSPLQRGNRGLQRGAQLCGFVTRTNVAASRQAGSSGPIRGG